MDEMTVFDLGLTTRQFLTAPDSCKGHAAGTLKSNENGSHLKPRGVGKNEGGGVASTFDPSHLLSIFNLGEVLPFCFREPCRFAHPLRLRIRHRRF